MQCLDTDMQVRGTNCCQYVVDVNTFLLYRQPTPPRRARNTDTSYVRNVTGLKSDLQTVDQVLPGYVAMEMDNTSMVLESLFSSGNR